MTRAEILEARRQLQQTRMDFLRLETEKYDLAVHEYDDLYYDQLEKLQAECEKLGHSTVTGITTRCSTCDKALWR